MQSRVDEQETASRGRPAPSAAGLANGAQGEALALGLPQQSSSIVQPSPRNSRAPATIARCPACSSRLLTSIAHTQPLAQPGSSCVNFDRASASGRGGQCPVAEK